MPRRYSCTCTNDAAGKDGPPAVFFSHLQVFAPQLGFAMTNRSPRTMVCDTTGGVVMAEAGSTVFMTNCVGVLFQDIRLPRMHSP